MTGPGGGVERQVTAHLRLAVAAQLCVLYAKPIVGVGKLGISRNCFPFALWKDADPDVPVLIEARKEYAAFNR